MMQTTVKMTFSIMYGLIVAKKGAKVELLRLPWTKK
jgi:hypothetical protein